MRFSYLFIVLFILSCGNKKIVELPKISNAKITKVFDVSPVYIFYDETQVDSTEFNRKNLISTTNWLVNVDKRLTLKQALPHLQYLQNKRRKASMHKNETAKNYFTCNDTTIGNLGFLEFTYIDYKNENPEFINFVKDNIKDYTLLYFSERSEISISYLNGDFKTYVSQHDSFSKMEQQIQDLKYKDVILFFDKSLSFQEYISIKSTFNQLDIEDIIIDTNEFFY